MLSTLKTFISQETLLSEWKDMLKTGKTYLQTIDLSKNKFLEEAWYIELPLISKKEWTSDSYNNLGGPPKGTHTVWFNLYNMLEITEQ